MHSKEWASVAGIFRSLLAGPPAQRYHVPEIPNAEDIFSCPLVEFAFFQVKFGQVHEYKYYDEKMKEVTKNLPAFIDGASVYRLENPWMHGLIAGWKYQEVLSFISS